MKISSLIMVTTITILISSCSSESSNKLKNQTKEQIKLKENATGKVVQVDFLDKEELRRQGIDPNGDKYDKAVINTAFATKKNWYRMNEDHKEYKVLSEKSVQELKTLLATADEAKTTLIIEVLSEKGATAVKVIIEMLKDTRIVKFRGEDKIYWYEEKNKPPQELEIRLYAAMQLEKVINLRPYGVTFDFHTINTTDGIVEVLYAYKGSFAVNKEDVCKNWLLWWEKQGDDYR